MKRLFLGFLLVILLAGTVGCASKSEITNVSDSTEMDQLRHEMGLDKPLISQILNGDIFRSSDPVMLYSTTTATAPAPTTAPALPAGKGVTYSANQASSTDRMIIRNGAMQLVVTDIAEAIKQITKLAGDYGGFVLSSNIQESQSRLYGNISIRVLSDRFNDTLSALRALAVDVKSETTSGQDVTEEYTDLSAKLRNLQAAEAQLLKLMEQAGKVAEILEVQKELVNTRGEIEQTKGRMQYLEQSSNLSLIQVTLEQSKLTVEFNATARYVKEKERTGFVPTISGGFTPYSYAWDFGDSQTSTEQRPIHAYQKDGTYTVSLKITDDHGNTVSLKRDNYITVISGWEVGNTARSAWNGFVGFMHFFVNLIIWLGIFSPVWIVVLVILYFTVWRKRKKVK